MFLEVKDDENCYIQVLKKTSSKHYKISDFARIDNIDIPFEQDCKIIGNWKTVAYVDKIEDLEEAIKTMLATPGPFLLDINTGYEEHVLPMIPPGKDYKSIILE